MTDLELVFSSKLNCKYAAYCGHSDSGKTTSVLKFKNDVRKIYPILYNLYDRKYKKENDVYLQKKK